MAAHFCERFMDSPAADPSAPFCSQCGYSLKGLTESSKCPECGRPLVEVLTRKQWSQGRGKRYRSKATLFGLPLIDVALGPHEGEPRGRAKGIIAVGDIATGVLALGGIARGVVSVGGMAVGLFSAGGLAVGLVSATGGSAVGALAVGGMAIGGLATGGGAAGVYAQGGAAFGLHVRDGRFRGRPAGTDPFEPFSWFFGHWPPNLVSLYQPFAVTLGATVLVGLLIALLVAVRMRAVRSHEKQHRT